MTKAKELCILSSLKNGVDDPQGYSQGAIDDFFYSLNASVLKSERGSGYWLWKPYIIADRISRCDDGDDLIYSDAGVEIINPVQEIIKRMDQDIFFFSNGWPHYDWCKKKVLDAMLPGWFDKWGKDRVYMPQVQASVIFFRVNQKTRDFVKEWLLWSQMPGFIDDSPSVEGLPEHAGFQEGRHDQSILCNLVYKYGYKLHWWPTQYSMHLVRSERDDYPCMFNHHRKRDWEW